MAHCDESEKVFLCLCQVFVRERESIKDARIARRSNRKRQIGSDKREGVDRKFLRGGSEQDAVRASSVLFVFRLTVSKVARGSDNLAHSDFLII